MATIEIKNVGPIKEAKFDLNKVNVFMGPQSSGKSTIAKIISYCTWVEKRRMLDGFFRENFLERLKSFHNLEDTYFPKGSYFKYEGKYCDIEFSKNDKPDGEIIAKVDAAFENRKHIYIPAERNFVASIPNLGRYKETNNNILDFLYYWYEAKKSYLKNATLNISELKISFYHVEEEDKDVIVLENGKELNLQNTSSGIQSMLPMYLLLDYLTRILYRKQFISSPFEHTAMRIREVKESAEDALMRCERAIDSFHQLNPDDYSKNGMFEEYEMARKSNDDLKKSRDDLLRDRDNLLKLWTRLQASMLADSLNYKYSKLIIEEPEQNLFPTTQRDLIYYMMRVLNDSERDHRLTFTTHSPYILYALNNCMMGYLVKDNIPENERAELPSKNSWINPEFVSIWEISESGTIRPIKNEETGTVSKHYFNGIMNDVMEEYYDMLTYLKSEDNGR